MRSAFALLLISTIAITASARAESVVIDLTTESIKQVEGLAILAHQRPDELLGFMVVRDRSKTPAPSRSVDGLLEIRDEQGVVAKCPVRGIENGAAVEYAFAVAPRHLERATFELSDQAGELGGTIYRLPLANFDEPLEIGCPAAPAK